MGHWGWAREGPRGCLIWRPFQSTKEPYQDMIWAIYWRNMRGKWGVREPKPRHARVRDACGSTHARPLYGSSPRLVTLHGSRHDATDRPDAAVRRRVRVLWWQLHRRPAQQSTRPHHGVAAGPCRVPRTALACRHWRLLCYGGLPFTVWPLCPVGVGQVPACVPVAWQCPAGGARMRRVVRVQRPRPAPGLGGPGLPRCRQHRLLVPLRL